jgi:hypothetical protein
LNFIDRFSKKKSQISNLIKIRPVGAELFNSEKQTNGRIDMTKLIVVFHKPANAPKNRSLAAHIRVRLGKWLMILDAVVT